MAVLPVCQDCCQIVTVNKNGKIETHSPEPYGERACNASGLLTGRVRDIVVSSALRAHAVRRSRPTTSWGPVRVHKSGLLPRMPDAAPDAMPAPKWLPHLKGGTLASVTLPAAGWLGVWLPGYAKPTQAYRVEALTQRNVTSAWSARMECWTVNNQHFLSVANALMRRHEKILVGREYNPREKCTSSCKAARGPLCTCSCHAKHHGGGRWMAGWCVAEEFGTVVDGSRWHWMITGKA
ncbi:hypothetical protein ACFCZQ_09665 [Streptomyces virginiae]|uniref:hypothetical protein n=1 Tax=Streptomyces virginiae TaxID=1961 RepID=UPI0035DFF1EB